MNLHVAQGRVQAALGPGWIIESIECLDGVWSVELRVEWRILSDTRVPFFVLARVKVYNKASFGEALAAAIEMAQEAT